MTKEMIDEKTPQDQLLAWAEGQAFYRKNYSGKHYSPYVCQVMNMLDNRVHDDDFMCVWQAPYGFVPEAGCPSHD